MLELRNISLSYDQNLVLSNLSLKIDAGEILGIIGHSGIGKTSILKLLAGYLDSNEGVVSFENEIIEGPSIKLVPGYEEIQLVNQDFKLDVYQTVYENIQGKILHLNEKDREDLIEEVLDLVELMPIRTRKAHELSGGEQQRLALARAIVCEPKCLLLDEPFVHLDQRLRFKIINYLVQLNEVRGTTIVLVSHDGAESMGFVNRMVQLNSTGIVRDDSPMNFFYHPVDKVQGELLGILNEINIDGKDHLFRSNEYSLDKGSVKIEVRFLRAIITGVVVLNYFQTQKNELIVLSNEGSLDSTKSIYIETK